MRLHRTAQNQQRSSEQVMLGVICDALELLRMDGLLTTALVGAFACDVARALVREVSSTGRTAVLHAPSSRLARRSLQ